MDPLGRSEISSIPTSTATATSASTTAETAQHVPSSDWFPASSLRSPDGPRDSPGLSSLKSADSYPVTGIHPFGSLRIHEPDDETDMDLELATPLTVPDRTPERMLEKDSGLLKGGDVLILDDLPANFTVGCDTISFSTTQQFLGFRDIPPGAHLIWVAPSESTSSRSAYWLFTPEKAADAPGKVYVKQWDKFNEVLSDPASQAEERFQKEQLDQMFPRLSPYQFRASTSAMAPAGQSGQPDSLPSFLSNTTIWHELTSAIRPEHLNRITGGVKETWPVSTQDRIAGETTMPEEARLYPTSSAQLQFTFPMDQRLFDPKAAGSELTQQALDPTSYVLRATSASAVDGDDEEEDADPSSHPLLADLQFAFLTGTHLGNYSCLEQWLHYVTRILFRCYRLAARRPRLARALVRTFHAQLVYNDRYLEGDVLDTFSAHDVARLQRALTVYKSRLNELLLVGFSSTSFSHSSSAISAISATTTTSSSSSGTAAAARNKRRLDDCRDVGHAFEELEVWLWRLGWDLRGLADGPETGGAAVVSSSPSPLSFRLGGGSGGGVVGGGGILRSGNVMLEDGEVVQVDMEDEFESEEERGEFAAVVVEVDAEGRPLDLVSV